MKKSLVMLVVLALLLSAVASTSAQASPRSYIILSNGNSLPNNLASQIAAAGGTITRTIPQIGLVVVSSSNPNFANSVRGVRSVISNASVQWVTPEANADLEASADFGSPPASGDDDFFFNLQWGHDSVNAAEAWNAGQRGQGVRVAVLDTGFDLDHIDLAGNIVYTANFTSEASASYALPDAFSHGSHTAGTVAALDNGFGTIGVAPEADLMLIKVLNDSGSGSFDGIIAGIVDATDHDADIISMSLGAALEHSGFVDEDGVPVSAREVAELTVALSRATNYAYQAGVTVIASAGNDASDGDHTADLIHVPSDSSHVISISATTTIGWATPTWDGILDFPASYTNFGRSVIDFGAPGGDSAYPGNELCTFLLPGAPGTVGSPTNPPGARIRPCWVFDLVFSTGSSLVPGAASYYWSAGTSMAAPHAAGVAAIIIGENGGEMSPAHVERELRQRARGQGNDPYVGAGVVTTGY